MISRVLLAFLLALGAALPSHAQDGWGFGRAQGGRGGFGPAQGRTQAAPGEPWTPLDATDVVAVWDAGAESFPKWGIKGGYDLDGSTDYFARTSGAIPGLSAGAPAYPLSVVVWCKTDTIADGTAALFTLDMGDGSDNRLRVYRNAAALVAQARSGGSSSNASAAAALSVGRWVCVIAVWSSDSSRSIYTDTNTTGATETTQRTATALDALWLGRTEAGSPWDGVIGPIWILPTDLSGAGQASVRAAIFNGEDPETASGVTATAYYAMDNDAGADSSGNGYDLTASGSPTAQNNLIVLRDQSGNGHHVRATTAAPTWSADACGGRGGYVQGTSTFLVGESAPATAAPFQVYVVAKAPDATADHGLVWLGDKDAADDYWALLLAGAQTGDPVRFVASDSSAANADTSSGYSADTLSLLWALEASATSRAARLDGASEGTNTTDTTPDGADRIGIGGLLDSTPGTYAASGTEIGHVVLLDTDSVAERPQFHAYYETEFPDLTLP